MTATDLIWIVARSTGTAALVALVLSVVSGMALRSGALAWLSHNRAVRAVHDLTSVLWLPLAIAHVIALMLDPYAKIGLADLLVPFLVSYGSFAIGLGTISLQLIVVVLVSTWLRSSLTQRGWLAIHRLSYVAFILAFAHGLLAGTDFAQPVLTALVWLVALTVAIVAFRRLTAARGRQAAARSKTVAIP
ncbi:MAG: methionine sulfoxide reductase heme-binding subunit [Chloroflexota bacterium]|jgi:sulfoxide reductase heme-binding subunit YedZ|nr:methionine sulfoxide reductase heme-binding subunit [Chloroflexota bacterium]